MTTRLEIGLTAAVVAFARETPLILVTTSENDPQPSLPTGAFDAGSHRTFEIALRAFVEEQTALPIGYVEQLYTFGDRGRQAKGEDADTHVISVGYLALTRLGDDTLMQDESGWQAFYDFFPWEDWRTDKPLILERLILPTLQAWVKEPPSAAERERGLSRADRLQMTFGTDGQAWDDEKVLERYELLYGAGLMSEAVRNGRTARLSPQEMRQLGRPMRYDHRRILATAMSRLRGKLKYRPVVFELLPETFTLTDLQKTVEAISGHHLHKQNFRRLVENGQLVEPTGEMTSATGGRPAALYRFRRDVIRERPSPGLRFGQRG